MISLPLHPMSRGHAEVHFDPFSGRDQFELPPAEAAPGAPADDRVALFGLGAGDLLGIIRNARPTGVNLGLSVHLPGMRSVAAYNSYRFTGSGLVHSGHSISVNEGANFMGRALRHGFRGSTDSDLRSLLGGRGEGVFLADAREGGDDLGHGFLGAYFHGFRCAAFAGSLRPEQPAKSIRGERDPDEEPRAYRARRLHGRGASRRSGSTRHSMECNQ